MLIMGNGSFRVAVFLWNIGRLKVFLRQRINRYCIVEQIL